MGSNPEKFLLETLFGLKTFAFLTFNRLTIKNFKFLLSILIFERKMKKVIFTFVFVLISTATPLVGQETIGLLANDDTENLSDGYTLFNPLSDNRTFLINNCGELVNQWSFSDGTSRSSYLLNNGNLLLGNSDRAEIRDWDDNIVWSLNYDNVLGFTTHHDIEPLPNGNFLVLVWDSYSDVEMAAQGFDTSRGLQTFILEKIVEIEPVGTNSANIVWEWKMFDHIVQDFDSSKPNHGTVSSNPGLIDINYDGGFGANFVWANAIDYNEELDQIIISSRHLNEILIIDHSTTTAEAASNSGGVYGKGGDFLWRWGNPEVYDNGTASDKKLGLQHDPKWIESGIHKGKISVFSNDAYGNDDAISSIHIIDPNDNDGIYFLNSDKFLPNDYSWSWDGNILGEPMRAAIMSGVQIMPNGNALMIESTKGRISEIDSNGNTLWVYEIPVSQNMVFEQFQIPEGNGSFRAHKYSENFSGFDNISFNNFGIIEDQNSISENCNETLSNDNFALNTLDYYPNPTNSVVHFEFNNPLEYIAVMDLYGKLLKQKKNSNSINLEGLSSGIYLLDVSYGGSSKLLKVVKR